MATRARSGGRRADLRWTKGAFAFNALGATSTSGVIVAAGNTSQTMMRVRGELLVYLDGTQAPGTFLRVAIGMLIQQAGVTATSVPLSDGEAPFFWYESFALAYEEAVTDLIAMPGLAVFRKTIDGKAMRVLRPDQEIAVVVEQATIGSSGSINGDVEARFLLAD